MSVTQWLLQRLHQADYQTIVQKGDNWEVWGSGKYDDYATVARIVNPATIMEVGVRHGYSIRAMLQGTWAQSVYLIDNESAGGSLDRVASLILEDRPTIKVRTFKMDTQTEDFEWDESKMIYPGDYIDLLHIDGNHEYEAALRDLTMFGRLLTAWGCIILDDAKDPNVREAGEDWAAAQPGVMRTTFSDNYNGFLIIDSYGARDWKTVEGLPRKRELASTG